MLLDQGKTVVKIRGKRNAIPAEKWQHRKRRKPWLQKRPASTADAFPETSSFTPKATTSSRKRRPHRYTLSRLEALPTEIIQNIFVLSGNLSLALASPELVQTLSSAHLQQLMASRMLLPVFGVDEVEPAHTELDSATRFLSCRFVTWEWFRSWLQKTMTSEKFAREGPADNVRLWVDSRPSTQLLPPKKLLRGPYTPDKVDFLELFTVTAATFMRDSFAYTELAYEGLTAAIRENNEMAVAHLMSFGLEANTEHLRDAVVNSGCNRAIVETLISNHLDPETANSSSDFDLLDPEVWAWITSAKTRGDENGQWLMELLQATL